MRNSFICCIVFAAISFIFIGCENRSYNHRNRKSHKIEKVHVYHLNDGRRCYYDSDTMLWYWLILGDSGSSTYYTGSESRPAGYVWSTVRGPINENTERSSFVSPDAKEVENISFYEPDAMYEQELVVDERGYPEVDADGNLVDPDQLAPDDGYGPDSNDSYDSVDSSDSYDSGYDSSDSGGGDMGGD